MPNEILDDNFNEAENENFAFILTGESTSLLFEAAKWAKISSLVIIGLTGFKLFSLLYRIYALGNSALFEGFSGKILNIINIIEPILTILVSSLLYSFSDTFIKGYKYDRDDLIDKSFLNLLKYYKFSVIIVGISFLISAIYFIFRSNELSSVIQYLIFIIPIGLLVLFFFQNKFPNSEVSDIQNNSTENK